MIFLIALGTSSTLGLHETSYSVAGLECTKMSMVSGFWHKFCLARARKLCQFIRRGSKSLEAAPDLMPGPYFPQ